MEPTLSVGLSQFDHRLFANLRDKGYGLPDPIQLTGGRSNRVWQAGDLVLKLYQSAAMSNPLFDNDPDREKTTLIALAETGMVPQLVDAGRFEGQSWLLYRHIEGKPWQAGGASVGQFLGRLHSQPSFAALPDGANGSLDLARQAMAIFAAAGGVPPRMVRFEPSQIVPPTPNRAVIHGDPVPGNLLVHDGLLTLIDWQCPQLGDPAEDLALFLSPAMQFLYRGKSLDQREVEACLSAYPEQSVVARYNILKPWFHWRMAAYCHWRAGAGDHRDRQAAELEIQAIRS